MAKSYRSLPEEDITDYLAQAEQGLAGVDPRAQKLARKGNPIGQRLVNQQLAQNDANRVNAADEARKRNEQAAKDAAEVAEENQARSIRQAKEQGQKVIEDVQTGNKTVARHADGAPQYEAGPIKDAPLQQETLRDRPAAAASILGGDGDSILGGMGASGGTSQATLKQPIQNDRGDKSLVPAHTATDERGMQTIIRTDPVTGVPGKKAVGTNEKKRDEFMQESDRKLRGEEIALKENNLKQYRQRFDPKWMGLNKDGVKPQFDKASEELNDFNDPKKSPFIQRPDKNGTLVWYERNKLTGEPVEEKEDKLIGQKLVKAGSPVRADQRELAYWQKQRKDLETKHAAAKAEHDKLYPQAERLGAAEREAAEAKAKLEEDKIRAASGITGDGGLAEFMAQNPGGVTEEAANRKMLKELSIAEPDEETLRRLRAPAYTPEGREKALAEIEQTPPVYEDKQQPDGSITKVPTLRVNTESGKPVTIPMVDDAGQELTKEQAFQQFEESRMITPKDTDALEVPAIQRKLAAMDIEAVRMNKLLSSPAITPSEVEATDAKIQKLLTMKARVTEQAKAEAKAKLEEQGREIAAKFIGTGIKAQQVAGVTPGGYQRSKGSANEMADVSSGVAEALLAGNNDIDAAIKAATKKASEVNIPTNWNPEAGDMQADFVGKGSKYTGAVKQLTAMKAAMDKAGIKPEDRADVIQDTAKITAWTENDTDNIRKLKAGDIVINPGRVFGQKDSLIAEINASGSTPAQKKAGVARLETMRKAMAKITHDSILKGEKLKEDMLGNPIPTVDLGFLEGYAKHVAEKSKEGITDKAELIDGYMANQDGRWMLAKLHDAIGTGIASGAVGIGKTNVGVGASAFSIIDKMIGIGGDTASFLGQKQMSMEADINAIDSAGKTRGLTGGYGIATDLSNTVTQMAPMLVGGAGAQGLKGIAQFATRHMAVGGWAAAQGWESASSQALQYKAEQKGSALTGDEIVATLQDPKVIVASFANAVQTVALSYLLHGGSERMALGVKGAVPEAMTVRQFLGKGGLRVLKDGTFRKEITALGRNLRADALDEATEETLNQALETFIVAAGTGKDIKLGDAVEQWANAGLMGGIVGGGVNQVRMGGTPEKKHKEMLVALQQQSLSTPPPAMVSTALQALDPQAKAPDAEELKQVRQLVGPSEESIKVIEERRVAYAEAIKAKDYKGAAAIDAEIDAAFTAEQTRAAADTADGVLLHRELKGLEQQASEATWQADEALTAAKMSGDKQAIAQAEAVLEKTLKDVPNVPLVRASVKLATGKNIADLTDAELRSVGYEPGEKDADGNGTHPVRMKDRQLEAQGLTKPLIYAGADGSAVITNEARDRVATISTRAADRVKMDEDGAKKAAQKRFDTAAEAAKQSPATTGVPTDSLPEGQGAAPGGTAPAISPPTPPAAEKVAPRPLHVVMPMLPTATPERVAERKVTEQKSLDAVNEWDAKYGNTHAPDGTPKIELTPTPPNEQNPQGAPGQETPQANSQPASADPNAPGGTPGAPGGTGAPAAQEQSPVSVGSQVTWESTNGQGQRSGKVVSIDTPTGKAMVEMPDGTSQEVPLAALAGPQAAQAPASADSQASTQTNTPSTSNPKFVANVAAGSADLYLVARDQNPSWPSVREVVAAARAAGLPVSKSMEKEAGPMEEFKPTRVQTTPEEQTQAQAIADTLKTEIEAVMPATKGRFTIQNNPQSMPSGGVSVTMDGGITLDVLDIAARVQNVGKEQATKEIRFAIIRHEMFHVAQIEYVENTRRPGETFNNAWERIYGANGIYGDLASNPQLLAYLKSIYDGKRAEDSGVSSWESIESDANRAAEGTRILLEIFTDPKRTKDLATVSELMRAEGMENSKLVAMLKDVIAKLAQWVDQMANTEFAPAIKAHLDGVTALYNELTAAAKPEADAIPEISDELATARATVGQAIREAFASNPQIKKNDDLRIALDDAASGLAEIMSGMPEDQQRPFVDAAIADWLAENAERAAELAKAEEANKGTVEGEAEQSKRDKAKERRRERESRINTQADKLINENLVLLKLSEKGKIRPRANAIAMILKAKQEGGRKLTVNELAILARDQQYNGHFTQSQWQGGGNNEVIRAIIRKLTAKPGEGQWPAEIANDLMKDVTTASEMYEEVDKAFRAISRGETLIDKDSPDYEGDPESIAKAEADMQAQRQEQEKQEPPPPTLDDAHGYAVESFGADAPITRKIEAVAEFSDRFSREDMPAVRAVIAAEFQRHAQGMSTSEWDAANPDAFTGPESSLLKFMRGNKPQEMREKLESLPVVDAESAMFASSTPTTQTPTQKNVEDSLTPREKQIAASEMGYSSWSARAAKEFSTRMADWMVTGKEASAKLVEMFRKTLAAMRKAGVALAIAVSLNTAVNTTTVQITQQDLAALNPELQQVQERGTAAVAQRDLGGEDFTASTAANAVAPSEDTTVPPLGQHRVAARSVKMNYPTPTAGADFKGGAPSTNTRVTADWVLSKGDNAGRPFAIADKNDGRIWFFDASGNATLEVPALFGRRAGDEVVMKGVSHRTPAGRFEAEPYASQDYGPTVRFDRVGSNNFLIHRVPSHSVTAPPAARQAALASPDTSDNRITSGCINIDKKMVSQVTDHFTEGGVVYILPETEAGKAVFEGFKDLVIPSDENSLAMRDTGSALFSSPAQPASPGRFRPKALVEFAKPYRGPSGAELQAYEWKHTLQETVDKRGEDAAVRVSNWEEAATNMQTGREIVHQFHVTTKEGKSYVVSLESALKILGYTSENGKAAGPVRNLASMLRTRAQLTMEAEALRPAVEESKATATRYEKERNALERERMPKPVFTMNGSTPIMRIGPLEKWGALAGTPESFAKRSEYDLRSLENEWRQEEANKRAGGKGNYQAASKLSDIEARIAKMDRKIQEAAAAGSTNEASSTIEAQEAPSLFDSLPPGSDAKFIENTSKAYAAAPEGSKAREEIAKLAAKREGMTTHGKVQNVPQAMMDFGMSGSFGTKDQPSLFDTGPNGRPSIKTTDGGTLEAPGQISLFSSPAYHGTPHKVDKFSLDKIGTGEGAQAYGWGLYFADSKAVAESYQKTLSGGEYVPVESLRKYFTAGNIVPSYGGKDRVISFNEEEQGDWSVTVQAVDEQGQPIYGERPRTHFTTPDLKSVKSAGLPTAIDGNLYAVTLDVNDEDLLDWDNRVDEYDPIAKAVNRLFREKFGIRDYFQGGAQSGQVFYKRVAKAVATESGKLEQFGSQTTSNEERLASEFFAEAGIPGIRYLDGNSRADGQGSYNYVIFDESAIKITEENGKPVEAAALFSSPANQRAFDFGTSGSFDTKKQRGFDFSEKPTGKDSLQVQPEAEQQPVTPQAKSEQTPADPIQQAQQEFEAGLANRVKSAEATLRKNFPDGFTRKDAVRSLGYTEAGVVIQELDKAGTITWQAKDAPMMDQTASEGWKWAKPTRDTASQDGALFSSPTGESYTLGLTAIHNLSAENLKFADEMGGLAVPSIAVVPKGQAIRGFGEITLIGGRPLADPELNPVFDADAYTARFPQPVWKKVSMKVAQAMVDKFKPYGAKFSSRSEWGTTDAIWDNSVNTPNPDKIVNSLKRNSAAKAAFLDIVHGIKVDPIMRPSSMDASFVAMPSFRAYVAEGGPLSAGWEETAKRKQLGDAVKKAITEQYQNQKGRARNVAKLIIDDYLDEQGLIEFGRMMRISRSVEKLDTEELDATATSEVLDSKLAGKEAEFYGWIEGQIRGMFADPQIKVGGRMVPYTIGNIADAMTSGRTAGAEKTMTFSEGQIRAMNAHRFRDLEKMRKAAATGIVTEEQAGEIRKELTARLAKWREDVVPFYKFNSTWDALDRSMEAIGKFLKGARTPSRMMASLRGMDFVGVPQKLVTEAMDIGEKFMQAPVPYFESKPQRVVRLDEFTGAVVPDDASSETMEILAKHRIEIEAIPSAQKNNDAAVAEAFTKLSKGTALFSSPSPVDAATVQEYLESGGAPTSAAKTESERVSAALAQNRPDRVAKDGSAYSQGDFFSPAQPAAPSPGEQIADAGSRAVSRSKARTGRDAVSPDLIAGLSGNWEALAREVDSRGRASAILAQLVNREIPVWNVNGTILDSPSAVHAVMLPIRSPYFESLKVMVLDGNLKTVHSQILTVGSVAESSAHPADILGVLARLREVHGKKYTSIVFSHNHPSGDPTPSRADGQVTRRLNEIADIAGWTVMDHIVTNGESYYSFREGGLLGGDRKKESPYAPRKKDGIPVPDITAEQRQAPWEAVKLSRLPEFYSPEKIALAAKHLRNGNPDAAHIFYLNAQLKLLAVERVDLQTLLDERKLTQALLAGRGREGAHSFVLDYPAGKTTATILSRRASNVATLLQMKFIDAISTMPPRPGEAPYESAREAGFVAEDPAQLRSSPSQPDLFTAATAPDATEKLGQVKVGTMNALAAYRTLTAKRDAGKTLSGKEEQQLLDAETALGQKLAFDMDALKGTAPAEGAGSATTQKPAAQGQKSTQQSMFMGPETTKDGQMSLLSSPAGSNERLDGNGNPQGIDTNTPGGANIGDAALPGNSAVTPEMDAAYLDAVAKGDLDAAQAMVDQLTPEKFSVDAWHVTGGNTGSSGSKSTRKVLLEVDDGTHFFTEEHYAKKWADKNDGEVMFFRLDLQNPKEMDDIGTGWLDALDDLNEDQDGIVYQNEYEGGGDSYLIQYDFQAIRADAVVRDSSGNIIPLSRRFNQSTPADSGGLYSSPPPDSPAIQQALDKMPPIHREVFAAVNAGATPAEVAERFKIPLNGVNNILNQVRARVVIATKAEQDTLKPVMRDGKFDGGRPDLAEGGTEPFAAVDQIRNDSGIPDVVTMEENRAEAEARLEADYEGEFSRLEQMALNGKPPKPVDVAMAKEIFRRETVSGGLTDPARRVKVALFRVAYREMGTEQGRALQMRRDEAMSPGERNAMHFTELLYEPSPEVQKRMKGADKPTQDAILKQWMDKIDAFKAEMKADGYDIEASLKIFHDRQQAQKEAEEIHTGTKAAMDEAYMKLSAREKTVIQLIRSGAKLSVVMRQTGMTSAEILDVKNRFGTAWRTAIQEAGKRFAENSLRSSPTSDIYDVVMQDLGWQTDDDFNDLAPDYLQKQDEKRKEAKKREKKKAKKAPQIAELTPAQQAAVDAAFERFQNADPSTWKAWWQETANQLTPMIGQTSFEQFRESVMKPWRDLWQTEMKAITNPAGRMSFEEWMAKPAEKWTGKQKDLLDERLWTPEQKAAWEAKTQGTFDVNDPKPFVHIANALGRRNGTWINKFIEWFKMGILSGLQTIAVNASGALFVVNELGPRRLVEGAWNDMLGIFGANDVRSATLSEFAPMARNVIAAAKLGAHQAAQAWNLEQSMFENYARALPFQKDFDGFGSERMAPALQVNTLRELYNDPSFKHSIGFINRFMRNVTFRELTAVDDFNKGIFAQMDVAALAHRIAAKEEGLKGDAYAERTEQLMKPGSLAWQRTTPRTKRVTFQSDLAYGHWTMEDHEKNKGREEGKPMTWKQASKKAETQSSITLIDAFAAKMLEMREAPFVGPFLHLLALPFINFAANAAKITIEVSPLGLMIDVIDGMRSLKRRIHSGQITKKESVDIANELYNKTRFIQTLTNQTFGAMIFLAVAGLSDDDDDDEYGRPKMTGSTPYVPGKKGVQDNQNEVMPAYSFRFGDATLSYKRFEPFASWFATYADLSNAYRRNGSFNAVAVNDMYDSMKSQLKEKLFLKSIGDIIRLTEDSSKGSERFVANFVTSVLVPNLIRQPIREIDKVVRDKNPMSDEGFMKSVAKRVGYELVPSSAPPKLDAWADEIPTNRGDMLFDSNVADAFLRIMDPTNVRFGGDIAPIKVWQYHYNASQVDSSQRISIEAPEDQLQIQIPGEKKPRIIALTPSERAERIKNVGKAAKEILTDAADWDWRTVNGPDAADKAKLITDTFTKLKTEETKRLKMKKMLEAVEGKE